jgi:uncharacterized membrane protein
MIEILIFSGLFGIAYLITKSNTLLILMVAALINIAVYPIANEYTAILEATIDFITILALISFADRQYWYQIGCLIAALLCHYQMEIDQIIGSNIIFDAYGSTITLITIMQLLGAGYAVIANLFERLWKYNTADNLFDSYLGKVDCKTCQKEQQKY